MSNAISALFLDHDATRSVIVAFTPSKITAATLYEAVAQGLAAIRANEWVAGIAQGLNVVKVSVADVRVEHEVRLMDFTKWLEKNGGSPREVSDRQKIRSILGMPVSR